MGGTGETRAHLLGLVGSAVRAGAIWNSPVGGAAWMSLISPVGGAEMTALQAGGGI